MNKKITGSVIAGLMIAGLTSFSAYAAMADGTVVIGNKAYDLEYADNTANNEEISNAVVEGGNKVYVKDFNGDWIDDVTGLAMNASIIPSVVYKSADKEIEYNAEDKDQMVNVIDNINVSNATTITFKSEVAPTAVTWNGVVASVVSYEPATKLATLTVPSITLSANKLVVNAVDYSATTVNYTIPVGIYGSLNVMGSSAELTEAIKNQADGQTWIVKAGNYDVPSDLTTLRDNNGKVVLSGGQEGWYMPITANNVIIIGENNPTISSSTTSVNGSWASQNFITVFGDNVKISGVTLKSKEEVNKVIEVIGDNFLLDSVIIAPNTYNFAGSIYFSNPGKTATISNSILNYGRISGLTGATGATINLKNDAINFAGAMDNDPLDNNAEKSYWAYYRDNSSGNAATVNATNLKVTMSNAMGSELQDAINMLPSGTNVELSAGNYYVPEALSVPSGVTLDKITNNANVEVMPAGTVFVNNVPEFKEALSGDATTIRMAAGIYEFDSQIRINKAINIIGAGDSTVITKGNAAWVNSTGTKGIAPIITITSDDKVVKLEDIKVTGAKNIIMATGGTDYGTGINVVSSSNVTLKNVTATNNAAAGLIVNSSNVIAENLTTSGNGWYGVNVDKADSGVANFTLTGTGVLNEEIQIFSDKTAGTTVTTTGYTPYKIANTTNTMWTSRELQNKASITKNGETIIYSSIQEAIDAADAYDTINVAAGTYQLTQQLKITKPLTIIGANGGVTIKATDAAWVTEENLEKNLISVNGVVGLVKLENLTISNAKRNGINIFESTNVMLKDIDSKDNVAAGLVVNNSGVVADNLNTSGNSWGYGVNVDNGSSPSNGAPATSFTINSGTISEAKQIVSDKGGVSITAQGYLVYINGLLQ